MESILTSCITAWFGSCTASKRMTLKGQLEATGRIIGVLLPALLDIYGTRLNRIATSFVE